MSDEYINEIPKITKVQGSSNPLSPTDAFQVIADFLASERENSDADFGRWEDLYTVAESLAEKADNKMKMLELRALHPVKRESGVHVTFEDAEVAEEAVDLHATEVKNEGNSLSKEEKAARKAEKRAKKAKKKEKKEAKKRKRE